MRGAGCAVVRATGQVSPVVKRWWYMGSNGKAFVEMREPQNRGLNVAVRYVRWEGELGKVVV